MNTPRHCTITLRGDASLPAVLEVASNIVGSSHDRCIERLLHCGLALFDEQCKTESPKVLLSHLRQVGTSVPACTWSIKGGRPLALKLTLRAGEYEVALDLFAAYLLHTALLQHLAQLESRDPILYKALVAEQIIADYLGMRCAA